MGAILPAINKLLNQVPRSIRKGTDAVYFCPKCNHYKPKLEINLANGKYHCWVCNFRGISFRSLFKKLNAPSEYYFLIDDINSPKLTDESNALLYGLLNESGKKSSTHQKELLHLPKEFIPLTEKNSSFEFTYARRYLSKRKVSTLDILRYNIGVCLEGEYKNTIIIPSYDSDGDLNFFAARYFYENSYTKYKLCPFSKNIIGFESFIDFDQEITIVEGQFDAIATRRNAIPLFGKTMSKKLKSRLLQSNTPMINIVLDNDAYSDALKLGEYFISNEIPARIVKLPGKDPSELGFQNTWKCISESGEIGFSELIISKLFS